MRCSLSLFVYSFGRLAPTIIRRLWSMPLSIFVVLVMWRSAAVAGAGSAPDLVRNASGRFHEDTGCESLVTFAGYRSCGPRECVVLVTGCGTTLTVLATTSHGAIAIDGVAGLSLVGSRLAFPDCSSLSVVTRNLGTLLHLSGTAQPVEWTALSELVPVHLMRSEVETDTVAYRDHLIGDLHAALMTFDDSASGKYTHGTRMLPRGYVVEARWVRSAPYGAGEHAFCLRVSSPSTGPVAYQCAFELDDKAGFLYSAGCQSSSDTFIQSRVPWVPRRHQ